MSTNAQRIKDKYYPDGGDISVGMNGQLVYVTWAEYALLEMIEGQQAQLDAQAAQIARLSSRLSTFIDRQAAYEFEGF